MKQGFWHRLDLLARSLTPTMITLLLVMAGMIPLHIAGLTSMVPFMALIAVYYWVVHKPDLMPLWVIFMIGLFHDLLHGGYVGVGILALLLVQVIVDTQRRYFARASFHGLWVMFAVVGGVAIYFMWLLNCILQGAILESGPALFQFLTTVAVYPLLAWIFAKVQKAVLV